MKQLTPRQCELLRGFQVAQELNPNGLKETWGRATFAGPQIQDWAEVKKVFTTIGGRWIKSTPKRPGYFELRGEPLRKFFDAVSTGEVFDPKLVDFFPTPDALADELVELADIRELGAEDVVLEPSAGKGSICRAIRRANPGVQIETCELVPAHQAELNRQGFLVHGSDFLEFGLVPAGTQQGRPNGFLHRYAAVVMNPPFGTDGGVSHVEAAYDRCLRPGGVLVSVMSAGVRFHTDQKTARFMARLDEAREVELIDNAPDAFKSSGTSVRTVTLVWRKP